MTRGNLAQQPVAGKIRAATRSIVALDFLARFFALTIHTVELRALRIRKQGIEDRLFSREPEKIARFVCAHQQHELYFGVSTREGGGTKEHCRELVALWCDVDVDAHGDTSTIERIQGFTPAPSLIVGSGGGFHCYWLLDEPIDAHDPRVEQILKALAVALAADPACAHIACILRIPGTFNHKPKYGSPQLVRVLRTDWDVRYSLDDFARFTVPPNGNAKPQPAPPIGEQILDHRNCNLASLAGTMRRRGMSQEAIEAALLTENANKCVPPLPESEVRTIARSIGRYQPQVQVGDDRGSPDRGSPPADNPVVNQEVVKIPDMPESVLDGRLGEICQTQLRDFPIALSWPAVLAAASVLVCPKFSPIRTNLYVAHVGPIHCGKSQATIRANYYLDLKPPILEELKAGSAEGLLAKIGDQGGRGVLLFPDELAHLLEKAQITNATFAYVLNSLFYKDADNLTIAKGKKVAFDCRLSVIGGLIDEKFDDAFGSATTGGLYDRFLFGQCPTGFDYLYRPPEGPPVITDQFAEPTVKYDVWEARDHIAKSEGINRRILEIVLRTAFICAAADGRELRAADLAPAWELARYQTRVRPLLQPNDGKNFEGHIALKILAHLHRHAPDGQWMKQRDVVRDTHAYDYGPSLVERTLNAMRFGGNIEEKIVEVGKGQKQRWIRLSGDLGEPDSEAAK